jgi:hypothetical protein
VVTTPAPGDPVYLYLRFAINGYGAQYETVGPLPYSDDPIGHMIANGFVVIVDGPGTPVPPPIDYVRSLNGMQGDVTIDAGGAGKSAYQIAVDNGFVGTEADWLASLAGTDGAPGAAGAPGRTFLDLPGEVFFSEAFPDADGTIIANGSVGRASQTGQLLVADGTKSDDRRAVVVGGRQTWTTLPVNGHPVCILGPGLSRVPTAVKTRFQMVNNGTTLNHNAVMGIAGGPGSTGLPAFATGSIQCQCTPTRFSLFVITQQPIVTPYPSLGAVDLATQIPDGEILEMLMVHDPAAHTIEATLMGDTNGKIRISVADCRYAGIDYWSPSNDGRIRFSWQMRRNVATDGEAHFELAEAAA